MSLPSDEECRQYYGLKDGMMSDWVWRTLIFDQAMFRRLRMFDETGIQRLNDETALTERSEFISWHANRGKISEYVILKLAVHYLTWSLIGTRSKHLVMAPRHAVKGDVICILDGAPTPLMLRSTSSKSNDQNQGLASIKTQDQEKSKSLGDESAGTFTVMGEAYWHDLMDGQVYECPESEYPTMTFTLI
jgi:hypothetical protein